MLWLPPSRALPGPRTMPQRRRQPCSSTRLTCCAALPDGNELLGSLEPGLANLVERSDLPPRLVHHLALLQLRAAQWLEEHEHTDQAEPYWRRSWQLWLRWLVAPETAPEVSAETTAALLDFLLGLHRGRVNDLLARNEVDRARRHWNLVQELPGLAGQLTSEHGGAKPGGPPSALASDLADRVARCRDELATEYLVTTREAMRFGDIAEGMHADYDKGLTFLRRLLSLDRDSVRLLTALVEVCGEYFLDLYHAGSPAQAGRAGGAFFALCPATGPLDREPARRPGRPRRPGRILQVPRLHRP